MTGSKKRLTDCSNFPPLGNTVGLGVMLMDQSSEDLQDVDLNSGDYGLQFSEEVSPTCLRELFETSFGEAPDEQRLCMAKRFGLISKDGSLVAGGVLEIPTQDIAYLWLLAVAEPHRNAGLGGQLLQHLVNWCRANGFRAVRVKSYRRWQSMRHLLVRDGWAMISAELSDWNDRVGEIWMKPLNKDRIPIVVIGGNPEGRGGEWAKTILATKAVWELRAVIDPDKVVQEHWNAAGIKTYSEINELTDPEKIEAAIVAVPPKYCAEIQKNCFEHGWCTLAEKPLAASLSELMKLQDYVLHHPARLVPGVQRRSHPSYVALKAFLDGKHISSLSIHIDLGKPRSRPTGHRADTHLCRGGALIDIGYHALDLAHFLLGEPLEMISCSLMDHGDLARGIESAANLLGRAGKTWVRIMIDRHGNAKHESVTAQTVDGNWFANRERVLNPSGSEEYSCEGSWNLAETGRLAELAGYCGGKSILPNDLWDHLALMEIIEEAYSLASRLGVKSS